jgi:hypothetical protein
MGKDAGGHCSDFPACINILVSKKGATRMKKFVTWIGVAVMALAMSLTAFATENPSVTVSGNVTVESATDDEGNSVDIVVNRDFGENQEKAEEVAALEDEDLEAFLEDLGIEGYVEGMTVLDVREVTVDGDIADVKFPLKIKFNVAGVTAGSKVIVLHLVDDEWQEEEATAGDGYIEVTFADTLSPVAFIVEEADTDGSDAEESEATNGTTAAAGATTNGSSNNSTTTTPTSPKTGQPTFPVAAAAVVVLGGAAIFFAGKERKANQ